MQTDKPAQPKGDISMRGKGPVFVKRREQINMILPSVALVFFCVVISSTLLSVIYFSASDSLMALGGNTEILTHFESETKLYIWFFMLAAAGLMIFGFLWSWYLSYRIFGPIGRMEREIRAVLNGEQEYFQIHYRKGDTLAPLFDLFAALLEKNRDKNPK